jgi:1-acyl-sn-glycerol-3-phosphate acyltransferase
MTSESVKSASPVDWLRPLRYLWRLPWLLAHLFVGLPVVLILISTGRKRRLKSGNTQAQAATHWWAREICRVFGMGIKVHGRHCPNPALVVANHVSWLDPMVLDADWALSFVAKAEIDSWPVIGTVARVGGSVFHHRGCTDSRDRVTGAMTERLLKGDSVAIFPEGRTGPGDRVLTFHGRLLSAAVDAGCPIQPVAIRFSRDGKRVDSIAFAENENLASNFFRILGEPAMLAELHYLAPIHPDGQGRRDMARTAQAEVAAIVES